MADQRKRLDSIFRGMRAAHNAGYRGPMKDWHPALMCGADSPADEATGRSATCTLPPHPGSWHQEWSAGHLLAEWGDDCP